jgi:protein tyrosine/serine phosphatase
MTLATAFRLGIAAAILSGAAFAQVPAGVGNFHQVNDRLYRGAQPTAAGFENLAKLGVKTVIDLCESGSRSRAERKIVESAGMRYIGIPFSGHAAPTREQLSRVLAVFDDPAAGPLFVHCRRGADRTGTVVACYRVGHDHWANSQALAEAKADGMSWMEVAMQHFVLRYQPPVQVAAGAAMRAGSTATAN